MDELIHHCLRELAFDGDLGCDAARLQEFIVEFYVQNTSYPSQKVDEAFCAFVWSSIIRNPSVRVGTIPPGAAPEVYIAPQNSTKRKAALREEDQPEEVSALAIIQDAGRHSLKDLKEEYGDRLRIAVDPEASFAAITGSHIRSPKLSPMVYTALQFVTRGRENGISVVDLGKRSGYDQKTCFYLVKQLLEIGLVVKVRRGGVGSHFCIHKYFYERSPMWQKIRVEETKAKEDASHTMQQPEDISVNPIDSEGAASSSLNFDPMDARHLSSLPLVRARVVKLLKACKNHMHESNNILLKLGFSNPSKTDRRFFQTRIRELMQKGVIEQVLVPNKKKKDLNTTIKCYRLIASDTNLDDDTETAIVPIIPDDGRDDSVNADRPGGVKTNITIHRQMMDLLSDAGTDGMTLNELSAALCCFDKRTIDLLLNRGERNAPPSHLRDLAIVTLMETHGRERRNRYYTLASYRELVHQENFDHPDDVHTKVDFSEVGEFGRFDPSRFYEGASALLEYQDKFKDDEKARFAKPRKYPLKNPILPDGTVKLGRPRKNPLPTGDNVSIPKASVANDVLSKTKRTYNDSEANGGSPTVSSRKKRRVDTEANGDAVPSPKKRGRPPKKKSIARATVEAPRSSVVDTLAESASSDPTVMSNAGTETISDIQAPLPGSTDISRASLSPQKRVRSSNTTGRTEKHDEGSLVHLSQESEHAVSEDVRPRKLARVDDSATNLGEQNVLPNKDSTQMIMENHSGETSEIATAVPTDAPEMASVQRDSTTPRSKVNVSHLRRENELLRVIEGLGGIAQFYSKEFLDAHMALIAVMAQAGGPTSSLVGSRLDKRTATATIDSMEARGRIKRLKTSVVTPAGGSRPACVVYLPDIDQDKLYTFLADLGRNYQTTQPLPIKRIDEAVEYGADRDRQRRRAAHSETKERRRKVKRQKHEEATADVKILLRRKAAETRSQREKEWEDMLNRIHPESLKGSAAVRVRQVRTRFLQSGAGKDVLKWDKEINDAVREANIAANKVLKKRPSLLKNITSRGPPPVIANPPEKSIESLIALQRPLSASNTVIKGKGKKRESVVDSGEGLAKSPASSRRHRFQWNWDLDELARDASAIVRVRCRNGPRLDLAAFEQVFPSVSRNTVRQRLSHLRETPGNDAYMNRLEDKWYELWIQHRGTSHLPDDDPQSPSNFHLITHINFLRKHVDKNALRIGFVQHQERDVPKLPASVEELLQHCDVVDSPLATSCWDFMWNATVEEGREKSLLQQAFTALSTEDLSVLHPVPDDVCLAEAALKMVFGTPNGVYNSEKASRLLCDVGEESVSVATKNLLRRGILSKIVRDPHKSIPGRTLKISEPNQNSLGGSIPCDTFQDALAFEEVCLQQNDIWQEWNLMAAEGDVAALIQLVSDDKVEFKVDTSQAQAARPRLDWNSKKADDDQIETAIHLRVCQPPGMVEQLLSRGNSPINPEIDIGAVSSHGKTIDDEIACCKLSSPHLVDCIACLDAESLKFLSDTTVDEKELFLNVLNAVQLAGPKGLSTDRLVGTVKAPADRILALVRHITESPTPILFWSGYSSVVLVHSSYLRKWTVIISEDPRDRIRPRRWFDISGSRINEVWDAASKAVIGTILFRPGISEAELIWRLRSVYDKQEVREMLRYLHNERFMEMRSGPGIQSTEEERARARGRIFQEDRDEKAVFWFVGDRRWYEV